MRTPTGTSTVRVHRYSYELANGAIPDGLLVCHRCATPLCVRPDHLFLGTQSDNVKDMHSKKRGGATSVSGERNGQAKLTVEAVRDIRTRFTQGESPSEIAREYGIAPPSVYDIAKRRSWKHVD
ncbi:HNH endonuclease [Streptomyces microflavus]|uniref:HNH endonuclease n=1 Tax=Streptomyces microflavus TaxID=1919 RepID=UPI00340D0EA2